MKQILLLALLLIIVMPIVGCSTNKQSEIYGEYTFEEVTYLSPLSSSTIDYINEQMAETIYIVSVDSFEIRSSTNEVKIESPIYVKEEVPADSDVSLLTKYQYTIYDMENNKTYWRVYTSADSIWIGKYVDNTANGKEIIMRLDKLK